MARTQEKSGGFSQNPALAYPVYLSLEDAAATLNTGPNFDSPLPAGTAAWAEGPHVVVSIGGTRLVVGISPVSVVAEAEVVVPPGTPILGTGGTVPKKQLRRAVRELLKREEKRKGKKRPKVLAREILEAIEAKGLGVQERRIAIRLIGEALRLELPSLFYSQPLIHDKGEIAKAILFLVQQAMQRILDEEEDEEAALLLLSAA